MNRFVSFDSKLKTEHKHRKLKSAVFAFVYYRDTFEEYTKYFQNIPADITLYLITSNKELVDLIHKFQTVRTNTILIQAPNRGRDIAALLVTAKPYLLQYDVFCFLHDKKEKGEAQISYVQYWKYLLWENMLASEGYIEQILEYMQDNNNIGVLFPPAPVGEFSSVWNNGFWGINYANTNEVYHRIGMEGDIPEDVEPMSIGTVFWAKVDALRPLFEYEWTVEDFPQEPLPDDGVISHAIERVFQFVAKAQGYQSQICTTTTNILCYVERICDEYRCAAGVLDKELGLHNGFAISEYYTNKRQMLDYSSKYNKIFIYGAGKVGDACLRYMKGLDIDVSGFIVTKKNCDRRNGLPIYAVDELEDLNSIGIVIAARADNKSQIVKTLLSYRYVDYYLYI